MSMHSPWFAAGVVACCVGAVRAHHYRGQISVARTAEARGLRTHQYTPVHTSTR